MTWIHPSFICGFYIVLFLLLPQTIRQNAYHHREIYFIFHAINPRFVFMEEKRSFAQHLPLLLWWNQQFLSTETVLNFMFPYTQQINLCGMPHHHTIIQFITIGLICQFMTRGIIWPFNVFSFSDSAWQRGQFCISPCARCSTALALSSVPRRPFPALWTKWREITSLREGGWSPHLARLYFFSLISLGSRRRCGTWKFLELFTKLKYE